MSELEIVRAGLVPYEDAWARQRELHAARVAGEGPDTLLLLEHPSVYTAGKRTEPHERPFDGTLPDGHATDDGVGLVYRGTELVEAVADRPDAVAYRVTRGPDGDAVEIRIEPRRLS